MGGDNTQEFLTNALTAMLERDKHYNKERLEHIRDVARMNAAIESLTESNKKVNESITELIAQNRQSESKIDTLKELILSKDAENRSRTTDLERRVKVMENIHAESVGERRVIDRNRSFWHANWYNILQVFVALVVLGSLLYATVTGKFS